MERAELSRLLGGPPEVAEGRDVIVEAREPAAFMKSFSDAVAAGGKVFLADPAWGPMERAQFQAVIGSAGASAGAAGAPEAADAPADERGWLCIPTGGSSGNIKLARHDQDTLHAAVAGFCGHFDVTKVNVVGLLPLHHVSGFMAWMRTVLTGGIYLPWSWKELEKGERPALSLNDGEWFLSLVPTQLQRLLAEPETIDWLRGFRAVFIGGGPAWPELVEAGARERLPLAFSYGMTETAAMVTALRPEEFIAGARGSGTPLPHASVTLDEAGRVGIGGASLFRGYWPDWREAGAWSTEDLARFDERGSLHVLGRRDALIITGGEKVDPIEVENALRATGRFLEIAVIGVPDAKWGEVVVACYPAGGFANENARVSSPADDEAISRDLGSRLAAYKRPKRYVAIADWPRNAQGKLNRPALQAQVTAIA